MVKYTLYFTNQAQKDAKKVKNSTLKNKIEKLLKLLEENLLSDIPPYEKLVGDLKGAYSRRININHRLVYQIIEEEKAVKILRVWTHYE